MLVESVWSSGLANALLPGPALPACQYRAAPPLRPATFSHIPTSPHHLAPSCRRSSAGCWTTHWQPQRGQAASGPAPVGSSWSGSCAAGRRRRARAPPGSLCSCGSRSPGWVSPALRCTECVLVSLPWTSDVSGDLAVVLTCSPCCLPFLLATLFGCRGDVGAAAGAAHTPAVPHRHRVLAGRCAVRCCLCWAQPACKGVLICFSANQDLNVYAMLPPPAPADTLLLLLLVQWGPGCSSLGQRQSC